MGIERNKDLSIERIREPEFTFTTPETVLFLTGVPLSGKSTIAPLLAGSIDGCGIQSMDILRIIAQDLESRKPQQHRNPFVRYGSCDSYKLVGDGSYSTENLIEGFNEYARAISSVLDIVLPGLEVQGARSLLFEGVQLTPETIKERLQNNNSLILLKSDDVHLKMNTRKLFGENEELTERYSIEKLLLLQNELIRQSEILTEDKIVTVDSTAKPGIVAANILNKLLAKGIIKIK